MLNFKHKLVKNEQRRKRRHVDWEYFTNNSKYIDLVWKNKNDCKAFIVVEDYARIDSMRKSTSLFDIKSIASSFGLYS